LHKALDEIVRFERMLKDEGALVIKFWFHLSKDQQKHRIKILRTICHCLEEKFEQL
jgi:polyphosphate kinase 2 (PPK2 family)